MVAQKSQLHNVVALKKSRLSVAGVQNDVPWPSRVLAEARSVLIIGVVDDAL